MQGYAWLLRPTWYADFRKVYKDARQPLLNNHGCTDAYWGAALYRFGGYDIAHIQRAHRNKREFVPKPDECYQ